VANSRFRMREDDVQIKISITCIHYLILFCTTQTTPEGKHFAPVQSWTSKDFKGYVQYLNERPFINYVLSHIKEHIRRCPPRGAKYRSNIISQLLEVLTATSPASYLLESWVGPHLGRSLPHLGQRIVAEDFRNRILSDAIETGFYQVAKAVLTAGSQVETQLQGKPLLVACAENGHTDLIRLLLEHGADVMTRESDGQCRTALHHASENGHQATVQLLLEKGAEIEAKVSTDRDRTALHYAADNGHDATVRLLVENGADIDARESGDRCRTALHCAAANGHGATVQLLLEKGADINKRELCKRGRTALYCAAKNGHDTIVQLLLNKEPNLNFNPRAELQCAVENGHDATVQVLLARVARFRDHRSQAKALRCAAMNGYEAIVRLLLESGADIDAPDSDGRTALHLTSMNGHKTIAQLLLKKGATIDARDKYLQSALHIAAQNRECEAVVRLLLKRANIEAKDWKGLTALHLAAGSRGCEAIVKLLLKKGADINAKDNNRKTPLLWATEKRHEATRQLLHKHGARDYHYGMALQRALLQFCCCGRGRMSMSA